MLETLEAMPELESQPRSDTTPAGEAPDALAGLYHMSNTAGAGTQDYVAINPVAIWAVVFGVASALVVLSNVLLAIPLVGAACGVVALLQIRSSNGTQTGRALAAIGLFLSLALGGGKLGYLALTSFRTSADENRIGELMHQLGQQVIDGKYDTAYETFTDEFRQRVSRSEFEQGFKAFNNVPGLGQLRDVEWNHQVIGMEEKPDTDQTEAYAMGLFSYQNGQEPRRVVMQYRKSGGVWRPDAIESIFPSKKRQQ
jgi:hypothetical protein